MMRFIRSGSLVHCPKLLNGGMYGRKTASGDGAVPVLGHRAVDQRRTGTRGAEKENRGAVPEDIHHPGELPPEYRQGHHRGMVIVIP